MRITLKTYAEQPTPINHKQAINLWLDAEKLVFFCGSGISIFPPTNLPLGTELIEAACRRLEQQLRKWGFAPPRLTYLKGLPLEALIGLLVEDTEEPDVLPVILEIANYFKSARPNRLHLLIATFLQNRRDCFAITTNYDTALEKGLSTLGVARSQPKSRNPIDVYPLSKLDLIPTVSKNSLIKIHGCAERDLAKDLILTTRQEAAGFSRAFHQGLKRLFDNSLVVFLGYSFSEPDCFEALIEVANFDLMWAYKNYEAVQQNPRIKTLLNRAENSYLLHDLAPFTNLEWDTLNPRMALFPRANVLRAKKTLPRLARRDSAVKRGQTLFAKLFASNDKQKILGAVINGSLTLRDFHHAPRLIEQYRKLDVYSEFQLNFWLAALVRNKNGDWKGAREFFKKSIGRLKRA